VRSKLRGGGVESGYHAYLRYALIEIEGVWHDGIECENVCLSVGVDKVLQVGEVRFFYWYDLRQAIAIK